MVGCKSIFIGSCVKWFKRSCFLLSQLLWVQNPYGTVACDPQFVVSSLLCSLYLFSCMFVKAPTTQELIFRSAGVDL